MGSFKDKKRYSLLQIVIRIIIINLLFFTNLFINRLVFGDSLDEDVEGILALYFFLYFLLVLVFIVLSGFETRLINPNKKRVLNVEGKLDWYFKMVCFGVLMLIAFTSNNNMKTQLTFLGVAFFISILFQCFIYFYYRHKIPTVIVDWTDWHRLKDDNDYGTDYIEDRKSLLLFSGSILLIFPMVILSNNLLINNFLLGISFLIIFSAIYLIVLCLSLKHFAYLSVFNMLSSFVSIGVLYLGYFIHTNFMEWSLFFVGFLIANYPLLNTNRKIARKIFSKNIN
ncbi:MAG: hypothetical protein LBU60_05475 [Clostridiales bacterium]|jgi:hypothetical protein|nr:hypothetical protein [Clostridiales bacterium]